MRLGVCLCFGALSCCVRLTSNPSSPDTWGSILSASRRSKEDRNGDLRIKIPEIYAVGTEGEDRRQ